MLLESSAVVANSTSLVLVTVTTGLVGLWIWSQQKPNKSFPPGPKGWPLIGNLLEFAGKKAPHMVCLEYAEKYGNIFSLRIGQRWTIVLNGASIIKEALLKKGVEFANRPTSYTIDLFTNGGKDIVFGQYSPAWKLHRKLAHSAFRTLATGNNARFEKLVYSVLPGLMELLDSKGSESFKPRQLLASTVYNIIATLCFGKQYDIEGPEIKNWMKMATDGAELLGNGLVADYIPALKHIPTSGQRKAKELIKDFFNLIDNELQEHREQYKGGEPKDLVEMLFHARQEIINEGTDDISMVTETHIRQTVADIFSAGSDTTILTMHWSIGTLIEFPEVQEKVAEEVDRVVGRGRLPGISDRDSLPYTVAALYEVMRYSSLVPLSVPHATSTDVEIGGYLIPKDTWVLVNLYSMHFDGTLWDEPQKFNPQHFLDDSGEVRLHPEGFLPFSTGRRVCLGESVAKAELFLLFAWLFQHYRFSKAPGFENTNYAEGLGLATGNMPQDYPVVVEKRF